MYRVLAIVALLSATPVVAQWTVTTYAGGTAPSHPGADSIVPVDLALNPAGNVYVTTSNTIWRVRPGGVAERFAGTGVSGYGGDGGPATAALLNFPQRPQADAAGNIFFSDQDNYRIRRVDSNGIITTVAGTGVPWVIGMDREGPATLRSLPRTIGSFVVKRSGEVYFNDQQGPGGEYQIRRVTTFGQLEVVAGIDNCPVCLDGDSVPAVLAHLKKPSRMVFDSRDNLYVVEQVLLGASGFSASFSIRRISPDGQMTRLAGCLALPCGPGGDGQPALNQNLNVIRALAADDLGNLYMSQSPVIGNPILLRRIGPNGLIQTIAQSGATPTPDLQDLYLDSVGRIVYRVGYTLRDVKDGSVTAAIPPDVSVFVPTPDGTPAQDVPLPSSYFMAVSRAGELHYTDGCGVRKFDRDGILRTVASWCEGLIHYVTSLAFDTQDRLWVRALRSGANNYSTFTVLAGGQILEQNLPQYLGSESIIAVDSQGRLFRMSSSVLNRVEADGSVRQIGPPSDSGSFGAIGTDLQGNLFFSYARSVYLVNDDGSFTKFFGDVQHGDFFIVSALFVDAAGRLWEGLNFTTQTGNFRLGLRASCPARTSFASHEGVLVQTARFCGIEQTVQAPDGSVYLAEGWRIHKLSPILRAATPVISTGGIVHSASYSGGPIAPGELISIFGFNFGPAAGSVEVAQAVNNMLETALKRTKVFFTVPSRAPIEGAITAATPTQINVFVPYDALHSATAGLVDVVVLVDDATSLPMRMPVVEQAFDLFTLDQSGSGQGAIFNQDGSLNGPANPAPRGTIVSLWGAGAGRLFPALPDGALVISTPYPKPNVPVTVRINGVSAEILYAGAAPMLPNGAFQINVRIPQSTVPGTASISVSVGSSTTTRNVTVAVQ